MAIIYHLPVKNGWIDCILSRSNLYIISLINWGYILTFSSSQDIQSMLMNIINYTEVERT